MAIKDGRKTQTRRIIKPQPKNSPICGRPPYPNEDKYQWYDADCIKPGIPIRCPYGKPFDRLWVRENGWQRPDRTPKMMREGADTWPPYIYDSDQDWTAETGELKQQGWKRRPSIHMPRWASQYLLEITDIRVQRIQEISDRDAEAEGVSGIDHGNDYGGRADHIIPFHFLWDSINADHGFSWESNPWVWVISFRRVQSLK